MPIAMNRVMMAAKKRADHKKQELAVATPDLAESRCLGENASNVGRAICHVGYDRQQEQSEAEINRKNGF